MGVIMDALNRRSPAEAAQYVLDHMASMVEPIQVIALRHVVERLLAEVATPDGTQERLRAGCPAWGPGSGYVHVSEVEMATLTAERDRLQRDRDGLIVMFNDEVDVALDLAARLAQAGQVVEAARAWRRWKGFRSMLTAKERDLAAAVDALNSKETKP